jgi:hypothetical protein
MVIVASIYVRSYIEFGVGIGTFLPIPTPNPPKIPSGCDFNFIALVHTKSFRFIELSSENSVSPWRARSVKSRC